MDYNSGKRNRKKRKHLQEEGVDGCASFFCRMPAVRSRHGNSTGKGWDVMNKRTGKSRRNPSRPEVWNERESRTETGRTRIGNMAGARLRRLDDGLRRRAGMRSGHLPERGCAAGEPGGCRASGRHSGATRVRRDGSRESGIFGAALGKAAFTTGTGMGFDSGRAVPDRSVRSPGNVREDGEPRIRVYPKFFRRIHPPR